MYDETTQTNSTSPKEEIINAIGILSQKSPSNIEISNANAIILRHNKSPNAINVFLHLLIDFGSEGKSTESKLVINFISTYVNQQLKIGTNIVRHKKQDIYLKLRQAFFIRSISRKYKQLLENTFIKFIHTLSSEFIKIRKDLCQFIVNYLSDFQFDLKNIQKFQDCFHLIKSVLYGTCSLERDSLTFLIQNLLFNFMNFCEGGLKSLSQRAITSEIGTELEGFAKIVSITRLLFGKADINKMPFLVEEMITSACFIRISLLAINLKVEGQKGILVKQGDKQLASSINSIKQSIFNMISVSEKIFLQKKKEEKKKPKYEGLVNLSKYLLQNAIPMFLYDIQDYPEKPLDPQSCYVEIGLAFASAIRNPMLFEVSFKLKEIIIFDICFRCLSPQGQDLQLPPDKFLNMKENLIKLDTIRNIKDAAEKMLEAYIDKVDGSISYIYQVCLNLMDFQLTALPKYFSQLPQQLTNSYFYNNLNHFQQIQTCLQILASMSYISDDREDIGIGIQAFIVRRQQFFSRIDIPPQVILCFFLCYSYYQDNFYHLIINGKADAAFHRALLFHAHELMKAVFNKEKKTFVEGPNQMIGLQIKDYFSSVVVHKKWLDAIFPTTDPQSMDSLVAFFLSFVPYFDSEFNLSIIEDILLEIFKESLRNYHTKKITSINTYIQDILPTTLAKYVIVYLERPIINMMICKTKMIELIRMLIIISNDPLQVMGISFQSLKKVALKEVSNTSDVMDTFVYFVRRVMRENLPVSEESLEEMCQVILEVSKYVDDECFEMIFELLINLNLRCVAPGEVMAMLIHLYVEKLQERDTDSQADVMISKILYLMIELACVSFERISGDIWLKILQLMVDFLAKNYIKQSSIVIGKATVLSFCIYHRNPQRVEEHLGHRIDGLWDCAMEDYQKYPTTTQRRILCFKMLEMLLMEPMTKKIEQNIYKIIKSCLILIYYLYEKTQKEWVEEEDEDMSDKDEEEVGKEPWQQNINTINDNEFIKGLPNQILLMRNICHKLNEASPQPFRKFISELPISIQKMAKDKIYFYEEGFGQQLKTILKIKKS